jgi:HEAT repeat protein
MLLVAAGDERAVQAMATQLQTLPSKSASIRALGDSGSRLAIPALMEAVAAGRDDDRAAAAGALARLGAREAVSQIKPLLDHPALPVRFAAAAALYRLDDDSGAALLNQSLVSESAAMRLAAAEALSVRPGGQWLDAARSLMSEADEAVQLGAARLVAPHDPELAGKVLSRLAQSDNLAMREEAGQVLTERVVSDFAELRGMLRSQNASTAGRAARRLLELVR